MGSFRQLFIKDGRARPKSEAAKPLHEGPAPAGSGLPEELLRVQIDHAVERAKLEERADAYKAAALSATELAERLKVDSRRKQLEIDRMGAELKALSERPPKGEGGKGDAGPAFQRYGYRVAFAAMLAACALTAYKIFGRPDEPGARRAELIKPPAVTSSEGPARQIVIRDEAGFRTFLASRYREVPSALRMSAFTQEDRQLVGDYFTREFADGFFRERAPAIFVSSADEVRRACARNEAAGCYFPGSNASIMASGESQHTRLHELVHFMEWTYTGGSLTYVERGVPRTIDIPTRLQEGMTELVTLNILGRRSNAVAYPIETRIASMMERAGGASVMNRAFFSGDWRDAQEAINGRLGEFTFERLLMLLGTDDPGNIRAGDYSDPFACQPLSYLIGKMRGDAVLRRELASMQRTDAVWTNSQDYCR